MTNNINYIDLINQKREIIAKIRNLDAEQFGAMSISEMEDISRRRKDVLAAIKAINNILKPDLPNKQNTLLY